MIVRLDSTMTPIGCGTTKLQRSVVPILRYSYVSTETSQALERPREPTTLLLSTYADRALVSRIWHGRIGWLEPRRARAGASSVRARPEENASRQASETR